MLFVVCCAFRTSLKSLEIWVGLVLILSHRCFWSMELGDHRVDVVLYSGIVVEIDILYYSMQIHIYIRIYPNICIYKCVCIFYIYSKRCI